MKHVEGANGCKVSQGNTPVFHLGYPSFSHFPWESSCRDPRPAVSPCSPEDCLPLFNQTSLSLGGPFPRQTLGPPLLLPYVNSSQPRGAPRKQARNILAASVERVALDKGQYLICTSPTWGPWRHRIRASCGNGPALTSPTFTSCKGCCRLVA